MKSQRPSGKRIKTKKQSNYMGNEKIRQYIQAIMLHDSRIGVACEMLRPAYKTDFDYQIQQEIKRSHPRTRAQAGFLADRETLYRIAGLFP